MVRYVIENNKCSEFANSLIRSFTDSKLVNTRNCKTTQEFLLAKDEDSEREVNFAVTLVETQGIKPRCSICFRNDISNSQYSTMCEANAESLAKVISKYAQDIAASRKTVVYEDETILVATTGHDYDFIATAENKTDSIIHIKIDDDDVAIIEPNDWTGFEANDESYYILDMLIAGNVTIESEE